MSTFEIEINSELRGISQKSLNDNKLQLQEFNICQNLTLSTLAEDYFCINYICNITYTCIQDHGFLFPIAMLILHMSLLIFDRISITSTNGFSRYFYYDRMEL